MTANGDENYTIGGVFAPVLTPFRADLSIDQPLFEGFCRWIVAQGAGLCPFGTNSEANSLTLGERIGALEQLAAAGVPGARMMPGTGACAIDDAVALSRAAVAAGAAAVLMLPAFFYKKVSDDGLFAFFAEVIERIGDDRLKVLLYHIPQISGVPISLDLMARLVERYPQTVVGLKDSSGDIDNTLAFLKEFPGLRIFPASEALLAASVKHGAAGCISATANINPGPIVALLARLRAGDNAGGEDDAAIKVRRLIERRDMIASLKAVIAAHGRRPGFARVRPPLEATGKDEAATLLAALSRLGYRAPGLEKALAGGD